MAPLLCATAGALKRLMPLVTAIKGAEETAGPPHAAKDAAMLVPRTIAS